MPDIEWEFRAYLVLASAEILVSIVRLEFSDTQSPQRMKGLVMGVCFLGISLENPYVMRLNKSLPQD